MLDYAAAGGTVIVQYNRDNTWTQYAPFPGAVQQHARHRRERPGSGARRRTILYFTTRTRSATSAWRNWVQERGTYFIVPDDQRYTDLIQIHEPFEHNEDGRRAPS